MAIEITVPELGESVLEATVSRWLKKEGDFVNVGEVLVELETDKVNLEVGAKGAGVLQKIEATEGADVKVGDVLGQIDEKASEGQGQEKKGTGEQPPAAAQTAEEPKAEAAAVETRQDEPQAQEEEASPGNNGQQMERQAAAQVSPVAARLARDKNVDISKITGTGNEGRVTKADVEMYIQKQPRHHRQPKNRRLKLLLHPPLLRLLLTAARSGRACRAAVVPSRSACWKPRSPQQC
jgi:2-oxoglutarate dehydrogenase E2 component (dihydrolipoamide succinyltransferase)